MLRLLREHAALLLLVACVALVAATILANIQAPFAASAVAAYAAVAVVLTVAASLFRTTVNVEFEEQCRQAEEERRQFEILQQTIENDLLDQQRQLDQREQKLTDRLLTYHEWMEFPTPVQIEEQRSVAAQEEMRQLADRDRELNQILSDRSEQLFDDILNNKYAPDGEVDVKMMRDDAYSLAEQVAKLYQPEAGTPLLETSFEQILRGVSRSCLQLLSVVDELPLDIKQHNINDLYGYVRQAVRAYGVYKATEPYWPYFNSAYFLARFAMGGNPLTLGAWWFAGSMSSRAAKALTTRVVNRQALALLHQVVRVIGYEVANVYGAGFQHRDANWIYATELCELVRSLPGSHDCLTKSLQETSSLQLRSEYDRIFLYRCLASRGSADPAKYRAHDVLAPNEREAVAKRLERFAATFAPSASPKKLTEWRSGVEARLDVKIATLPAAPVDPSEQEAMVARSLAGFLIEIKQVNERDIDDRLQNTQLLKAMSDERRNELRQQLKTNPPYFFELPDLSPDTDVTKQYLDDLVRLAVRTPPHTADIDELLENAAVFLRQGKQLDSLRERHLSAYLEERFEPHPAPKKVPIQVARAVLDLIDDGQAWFLVGNVEIRGRPPTESPSSGLWLLRLEERLILFSVEGAPQLIWRGEANAVLRLTKGYLADEVEIAGGAWLSPQPEDTRIVVSIGRLQRNQPHAKQLADLSQPQPDGEADDQS